jgi:hypothetical protein
MKMTKDEAKALAKKGIEVSKKYNIPLKPKKKKQAKFLNLFLNS